MPDSEDQTPEQDTRQGGLGANGLLLLAAAIWGFAFVAQRAGMEHVGPFTFNGVRFFMGGAVLIPLLLLGSKRSPRDRAGSPGWVENHPNLACAIPG
ncbi:MAG: EamA family transporter, partial [Planctomycetota bacterium]